LSCDHIFCDEKSYIYWDHPSYIFPDTRTHISNICVRGETRSLHMVTSTQYVQFVRQY